MTINRLRKNLQLSDLDLLHFEQLKSEVQSQYLADHTPSFDDISKWKGIDIIYFQEDLRKKAKGNISEKSFYTYFKNSPVTKLPRIDMLNILSVYAGYVSWYDFKKNHLFADEILKDYEELQESEIDELEKEVENAQILEPDPEKEEITQISIPKETNLAQEKSILQKNNIDNQPIEIKKEELSTYDISENKSTFSIVKKYIWLGISAILAILAGLLGFKDEIFSKKYYYSFIDADRNSKINAELQV